ncbi:shikimate kinase [Silvibacterium sp.]|uniref:shikimate kinase n=1 Tax=Silvibacterium sp. TaxID=1964179 RepID=UPI0039E21AAC
MSVIPSLPSHDLAPRRIILIGFMGAGKSTTGRLLARALGWRFADSDELIQKQAGRTIAEIFSTDGEPAFRALESSVICEHSHGEKLVLALGGGAIEHPATREHLHAMPNTRVVYLEAPLELMIQRCLEEPGGATRPILADRTHLADRFQSRLPHYRSAHLTVPTAHLTPEQVVDQILAALEEKAPELEAPTARENAPTR